MKLIKYLRNSRGESQDIVASSIGVTSRGYRKIENGECLPCYKNIKALEQYFQKPIDELLKETDLPLLPTEISPDVKTNIAS